MSRRWVPALALSAAAVAATGVTVVLTTGHAAPRPQAAPGVVDVPSLVEQAPPPAVPPVRVKPVVRVVAKRPAPKAKPRAVASPRPAAKPAARPAAPKPVVTRTETAQQRGQRVLASLHYDWQALGYRIVFLPERSGYLGFTDSATKTVTIWVRKRETDLVLAHTIAHELGHVLDFTRGTDAKHASYLSLRGMSPTTDWYGCNGCSDYRTPAGDWAEVFAYWLAGPGDYRSQMGPPPDEAHMRAIALLYKT